MRDIEMRADGLVAGRQQTFDCLQRRRFHQIHHHRGGEHVHASTADVGRGMLFADDDLDAAFKTGLQSAHDLVYP